MDDIERQKGHFDKISETYHRSRKHRNHLGLKKLMWDFFLNPKKDLFKEPLSVLEPMCGFAEGRQILAERFGPGIDYEGFDISVSVIKTVRQESPHLKVMCSDVTNFVSTRQFDVLILIGGLHHVYRHANGVVRVLSEALKDGGYFINFEPTHGSSLIGGIRRWIYRRNSLFDDETEQGFAVEALNQLFFLNGFKLIDQIYPGLLSYVLFYNPDAFPFLNIGGPRIVRALFAFDRLFFRLWAGRYFSFATLSLWQKIDRKAVSPVSSDGLRESVLPCP